MEQELTLTSVSGEQLWGKIRQVPASSRAIVVLVHGIGEHIQRYDHVVEAFAERGFAVMGFDQQGHGRSGGKRGVVAPDDSLLRDIENAVRMAKEFAPGKPVFLYGHSLGALEVLYYGLKSQEKVDAIIATSPSLDLRAYSPTQMALVKLLKPLLPNLAIDTGLDPEHLSHDPGVVRCYQSDPLVHPKATAGLAGFMIDSAKYVMSHAEEWNLPLYLAHGTADMICPIEGSRVFASRLGNKLTYQEWEGLAHETHNEPERDQVLAAMLDWLEGQV